MLLILDADLIADLRAAGHLLNETEAPPPWMISSQYRTTEPWQYSRANYRRRTRRYSDQGNDCSAAVTDSDATQRHPFHHDSHRHSAVKSSLVPSPAFNRDASNQKS
jgi:hypothetical protein